MELFFWAVVLLIGFHQVRERERAEREARQLRELQRQELERKKT